MKEKKPENKPLKTWRVESTEESIDRDNIDIFNITVQAVTRGEARAAAKRELGLKKKDRLPIGTKLVLV